MLKIGDKVQLNEWSAFAEVVGVYGKYIWLKFRDADEPQNRLASEYTKATD